MRLLIILLLSVSGCATAAKYDRKLQTWKGKSVDSLILAWGAPTSFVELTDGRKMVEYHESDSKQIQHRMPNGSYYIQNLNSHCTTRFIIDKKNLIQSYSFEGSDCISK